MKKNKKTKIEEILNGLKMNKTIESNEFERLNPIEKEIVRIALYGMQNPYFELLALKLKDLSDLVSERSEVPFFGTHHIYKVFDPIYDYDN